MYSIHNFSLSLSLSPENKILTCWHRDPFITMLRLPRVWPQSKYLPAIKAARSRAGPPCNPTFPAGYNYHVEVMELSLLCWCQLIMADRTSLPLAESDKEKAKNIHFNWSTSHVPFVPLFYGPLFQISFCYQPSSYYDWYSYLHLIIIFIIFITWLLIIIWKVSSSSIITLLR